MQLPFRLCLSCVLDRIAAAGPTVLGLRAAYNWLRRYFTLFSSVNTRFVHTLMVNDWRELWKVI